MKQVSKIYREADYGVEYTERYRHHQQYMTLNMAMSRKWGQQG